MNNKLLLIGGGGHCQSCIDVIELENKFQIVGIIDNNIEDNDILGHKVLGDDNLLPDLIKKYPNVIITVGQIKSAAIRKKLYHNLKKLGATLPSIVSPRSHVSKHASISEGTIIMHDAIINAGATVGVNCIINSKALVEHNAKVGNHCHLSTGAILNGNATLSEESFMGSNSVSLQGITIPPHSIVPAGTFFKGAK